MRALDSLGAGVKAAIGGDASRPAFYQPIWSTPAPWTSTRWN